MFGTIYCPNSQLITPYPPHNPVLFPCTLTPHTTLYPYPPHNPVLFPCTLTPHTTLYSYPPHNPVLLPPTQPCTLTPHTTLYSLPPTQPCTPYPPHNPVLLTQPCTHYPPHNPVLFTPHTTLYSLPPTQHCTPVPLTPHTTLYSFSMISNDATASKVYSVEYGDQNDRFDRELYDLWNTLTNNGKNPSEHLKTGIYRWFWDILSDDLSLSCLKH